MRLNNGVSPAEGLRILREAQGLWHNVLIGRDVFDAYFHAVDHIHSQLSRAFAEPDLAPGLHSVTYWHAVSMDSGFLREGPRVIRREIEVQMSILETFTAELLGLIELSKHPGIPIVYDTNMLNHWQQPSGIVWPTVLKEAGLKAHPVRLIIPLTVIDELDRQKYGQGDLARKAATAIRYLDRTLGGNRDNRLPVEIRKGQATLEIWPEGQNRRRNGDADLAILDCASEIVQLLPTSRTYVLTGDIGMRLRAQQRGISTIRLPDEYRKPGTAIGESLSSPQPDFESTGPQQSSSCS
ncbi:PIN domain-containing protein [Streptomyces sp. NPDC056707]|uniref:PIN domain-containing protein n=1 Tax=Streptomyces sp. NPDC056707 TaxID=3345919 RepID=UPI003684B01E